MIGPGSSNKEGRRRGGGNIPFLGEIIQPLGGGDPSIVRSQFGEEGGNRSGTKTGRV